MDPCEEARTYSSVFQDQKIGDELCKSMLGSETCWAAGQAEVDEWLTMDLGNEYRVVGVETRGRGDSEQWVTKYKVQYSLDGEEFAPVDDDDDYVFDGNEDNETSKFNYFKCPVQAQYVRILVQEWEHYISMRATALVSCIQEGDEKLRTFSSVFEDAEIGTELCQSLLESPTCWSAAEWNDEQWMQIDLGIVQKVVGVITAGRETNSNQYVTKFVVQYSEDGEEFTAVDEEKVFDANFDHQTKIEVFFSAPVSARYIKFEIKESSTWVSMRAGVLVSDKAFRILNIEEEARSYSSVHSDDLKYSMIDSETSWSVQGSDEEQWMQMSLENPEPIIGVVTQGRNLPSNQFVTAFAVQCSEDGEEWTEETEEMTFTGNDTNEDCARVINLFPAPITAQHVKILPKEWEVWISMRAAVLVHHIAYPFACGERPAEEKEPPAEEEEPPAEEEEPPAEEEEPPAEEEEPPAEEDEKSELEEKQDDTFTDVEKCEREIDGDQISEAAAALRKAMKGFGTNEKEMISVIADKSCAELVAIKQAYADEIERDLIKDIKSECSGSFEDLLVGLFTDKAEYDAWQIHKAISGVGTNESRLIEVLCTRTSQELTDLREAYQNLYNADVLTDIEGDTKGNFEKLCVLLLKGKQEKNAHNDEEISSDVEKLYKAGEDKFGTDEGVFIRMLGNQPRAYREKLYWAYAQEHGKALDKVIKSEFSGRLEKALIALVLPLDIYFCRQFEKALEGLGTNDSRLIRLVVTQKERHLRKINASFLQKFKTTLTSRIKSETSGDFSKMLIGVMENWANLS